MTTSRRRHPRAPYTERVAYFEWDRESAASGAEIGEGGMFIRTDHPPHEGSLVTLRVPMPGGRAFTALARVVRTVRASRLSFWPTGMAVRFLDLPGEARRAIAAYVETRATARAC
jgi:uncharacterized protein (TIGR02266 family)